MIADKLKYDLLKFGFNKATSQLSMMQPSIITNTDIVMLVERICPQPNFK